MEVYDDDHSELLKKIAEVFAVPPHLLGSPETSSLNYACAKEQELSDICEFLRQF